MPLRGEVTELLQELLRANTVNPPGNELRAAEAHTASESVPLDQVEAATRILYELLTGCTRSS